MPKTKAIFGGWLTGATISVFFVATMTALNPGLFDSGGIFQWSTMIGIAVTGCLTALLALGT